MVFSRCSQEKQKIYVFCHRGACSQGVSLPREDLVSCDLSFVCLAICLQLVDLFRYLAICLQLVDYNVDLTEK